MFGFLKYLFGSAHDRLIRKYRHIVEQIAVEEEKLKNLSDSEIKAKTEEFKSRLKAGETLDDILPEAYAVVKNVCRRLAGTQVHVSGYDQKWDMVPYDVQLIGAIALHKGTISEMQTGEGKTLTATLPLYLNALTGKPVHLVTVNDYLAKRDCQWVGSILRWLGITTGALTNEIPMDERQEVYKNDVVYGTASEFGFDYLRDNSMATTKDQKVQRGFYFAIIDEVDSILIDEARTPLIISGPAPVSRQMYDTLKEGVHNLVRKQRDFLTKLASDAFKILKEDLGSEEDESSEAAKKFESSPEKDAALKNLWLVNKGTPRNKIVKRVKENPDLRAALDKWDLYFYAEQNKEERKEFLSELYLIIDEKSNDFELTDKGINAWNSFAGGEGSADDFVMLDLGDEYHKIDLDPDLDDNAKVEAKLKLQEEDLKRKERAHNLRQLFRAHLLMERDVDYIVQESKIVIIDENTGRPQPGRRFSDGLHQAIEAKEGVPIQRETQTYATITLQNFFRMYEKIAGMTGTAMTEANEFKQIYKLDVLEIPTHKKGLRDDFNDEIYMSEREKYNAILKEVKDVHEKGRPILIGTDSVSASEKLSRIFKQNNLPHTVLNAKQHEREAEIVAEAGKEGAITIATNMAGRGTDIKLGEGVAAKGGLHVLGTTRHQSRRIDRQLRGRCARQGDPGTTKFYISFEDPLLRLFSSPRMTALLQKFRPPEGEPISAGMLNRSIETAQKRVEQRNYTIRKHTLEYDDVMNKQRQEIYAFRNEILETENPIHLAKEILDTVVTQTAEQYFMNRSDSAQWDAKGFCDALMEKIPLSFNPKDFDDVALEIEEIENIANEKIASAFTQKIEHEKQKIVIPQSAEGLILNQDDQISEAVRNIMIRKIDQLWIEHLLSMDHLRTDVNLRSFGQRDPLLEFKHEGFKLFDEFGKNLRSQVAHDLFRFEMMPRDAAAIERLIASLRMERERSFVDEAPLPQAQEEPLSESRQEAQPQEKLEPVVIGPKTGRNDPCPCGSGQKYKKCCGKDKEFEA
ncbi:preprotein translocase subunit SecA [Estrella lausannensis]|uniref:Protein translocase subunit SecA n=1 Tax=Estrella lausannensis TaxID=483423 RepID=A0A0H5DSM8_9BACT|nr:preprotein translocase subunit SecA [Estrella lausannensis]CRX38794.1 Protein translocase subunit secA [Estrella lausannensis]